MSQIKEQIQNIIETCERLYEAEGMSAVFKHVYEGMEAKLPMYDNIEYKHCTACENECPTILDICLVCGQSLILQQTSTIGKPRTPELGDVILTVGELRELMSELDDHDQVVVETCDEEGDVVDLYPMSLDIIDGIKLTDGTEVREVRFCQRPHENVQQPSEEAKQQLIDAVLEEQARDIANGDFTVLEELLMKLPYEILKGSLSEDRWEYFNNLINK